MANTIDYLEELKNEAIYILRETAAQFEKPALLYSGGKDSNVLVHLALKAFRPEKFPFPLVHIDIGHNLTEAIAIRDYLVIQIGEKWIIASEEDSIKKYDFKEAAGRFPSRNALQTYALLDAIEENQFDGSIGKAFLETLETIEVVSTIDLESRFQVQWVIRPKGHENYDYRGFAGLVLSGSYSIGDTVNVLPAQLETTIVKIEKNLEIIDTAKAGDNVVLHFEHNIDISRGDTVVLSNHLPRESNQIDTWVSWLDNAPLQLGKTYLFQHRFKKVRVKVQSVNQKWNINDWKFVPSEEIKLNDIAQITVKVNQPLYFDAFDKNSKSGKAILVDETSFNTVGALMFL
ncbi:phosphoadenosine phosphosulfate reductase family protein [Flavobacterium chuncheonense]|uniref:Phosphoadenosine phosphosulfate reductase family protein n=1 Tax=Flavobacterium chuncheonense TaxID=2026653 RepID=A0ABW5YLD7_9FLAO